MVGRLGRRVTNNDYLNRIRNELAEICRLKKLSDTEFGLREKNAKLRESSLALLEENQKHLEKLKEIDLTSLPKKLVQHYKKLITDAEVAVEKTNSILADTNGRDPDFSSSRIGAPFKIAGFDQSESEHEFRLGASLGECGGFVQAMGNPNFNPFKNPKFHPDAEGRLPVIHLDETIGRYQRDQDKPNPEIKMTRLTRRHFCPEIETQVKEIYDVAFKNKGKELFITLMYRSGCHAVYLCVLDHEIWFMEPNYGAYRFPRKEDFFDVYIKLATKKKPNHYKFYEIAEMNYDSTQTATEQKTLSGKLRTLLTGPKYPSKLVNNFLLGFIFLCILMMGLLAGSLLKELAGIETMGLIMVSLLTLFAMGEAWVLDKAANLTGYPGTLGIPHYLKELYYDVLVSKKPLEQHIHSHMSVPSAKEKRSSTTALLTLMPPNIVKDLNSSELKEPLHHNPLFFSRREGECSDVKSLSISHALKLIKYMSHHSIEPKF